jgi:urease accessory protein
MLRATSVKAAGTWREAPADSVVLEFDDRHRRRLAMTATRGLNFLLDLPQTVALRGGDALVLEDGRLVEVVAAPEPLIEIRGVDPRHLVRVAWHLGNRHLPVQIAGKHLRIRRDHVIEDMVKGLGATVVEIEAPFDPEGGAYVVADHGHPGHGHGPDDGHHHHGHDHRHGHDHDHGDGHGAHDHAHHDHRHDHEA